MRRSRRMNSSSARGNAEPSGQSAKVFPWACAFPRHRQFFLFSVRSWFAFEFLERRSLVHGHMLGRVALDQILGSSFEARTVDLLELMAEVTFFLMFRGRCRFPVPFHMIPNREFGFIGSTFSVCFASVWLAWPVGRGHASVRISSVTPHRHGFATVIWRPCGRSRSIDFMERS